MISRQNPGNNREVVGTRHETKKNKKKIKGKKGFFYTPSLEENNNKLLI